MVWECDCVCVFVWMCIQVLAHLQLADGMVLAFFFVSKMQQQP